MTRIFIFSFCISLYVKCYLTIGLPFIDETGKKAENEIETDEENEMDAAEDDESDADEDNDDGQG